MPAARSTVAAAMVVIAAWSGTGPPTTVLAERDAPETVASAEAATEAAAAARTFLDRYVEPDGRVVRHDQGGDTVSEGQAYGMLIAAAVGDAAAFDAMRRWTFEHLMTERGLLAFRWSDGEIADRMPAADADLLVAAALVLAGDRFGDRSMAVDRARIADAIVANEVVDVGGQPVLVAGPWAHADGIVNPSYFVLPAMSLLADAGDYRWAAIAATSRRLTADLMAAPPHLPPDWATVSVDDGSAGPSIQPRPAPGGDLTVYGFEAVRLIVQLAADCDPAGRELAARAWPFLAAEVADGTVNATYHLDGTPASDYPYPAALVAAAAAAHAAGDAEAAAGLLDVATELDDARPTYYGAVWIALARLWLDTDLLTTC
ncbi:glycosyl hydrolase family 8 [Desertimonas flava]|uniref:glycosyl hydrolase family 8 n=1 Tax=Desertimonas flava TaxID=2064846 RepID=UPI0013C3EDCD|nr:glycosyl hydrolase family 8 [Desertimonas flava]